MAVGTHPMPSQLLSNCTEGTGVYCISKWANDATTSAFWPLMLLAFCTSLFLLSVNRWGGKRSFGFASFVGMLGAVFFAIMNLMAWWIASAYIITGMIGIAMMIMDESR